MIKLKYTTYVKILVIIVIKMNKKLPLFNTGYPTNNYLKYTMIKLKYTIDVEILVIFVIKINKNFLKKVRFQMAFKNP